MLKRLLKIHPIWMVLLSIGVAFAGYWLAGEYWWLEILVALSFLLLFIAFALATIGFIRGVIGVATAKGKTLAGMIAGMILCAMSMVLIVFAGIIVFVYEFY